MSSASIVRLFYHHTQNNEVSVVDVICIASIVRPFYSHRPCNEASLMDVICITSIVRPFYSHRHSNEALVMNVICITSIVKPCYRRRHSNEAAVMDHTCVLIYLHGGRVVGVAATQPCGDMAQTHHQSLPQPEVQAPRPVRGLQSFPQTRLLHLEHPLCHGKITLKPSVHCTTLWP